MLVSFKNGIDISAIDLSIFGTVGSAIISLLPSKVYDISLRRLILLFRILINADISIAFLNDT
jgi:hypothetical protein